MILKSIEKRIKRKLEQQLSPVFMQGPGNRSPDFLFLLLIDDKLAIGSVKHGQTAY